MALRIADYGQVHKRLKLLGVMLSATLSASPGSVQSLMANDGVTGVPVGTSHTSNVPSGTPLYQADLRSLGITAGYITGNETYADAVTLYRQLLANTAAPIDIVSVGPLNNLSDLLQSSADSISPLTGLQLVTAKVRRLYVMGGQYPSGSEFNFNNNSLAMTAGNYVVANWPTPIVYSGFEVGTSVLTGASLSGKQPGDLAAQAMADFGSFARMSWDPMNALLAMDIDPDSNGYTSIWGSNSVNAGTGANTFTPNVAGRDRYTVKSVTDATFQARINNLIDKTTW